MASLYKNEVVGKKVSPKFVFIWEVHIILENYGDFK